MPLTTLPIFPTLPGQGWPSKGPSFATRAQKSVSGRKTFVIDQAFPIWQFTVPYDVLRDGYDIRGPGGLGVGLNELRTLMGLFLQMYGMAGAFAFEDPSDYSVVGTGANYTGTAPGGDGVTTEFQLYRALLGPGASEPITAPNIVDHVYVNGVDPGGWSVSPAGVVTLGSPPANGANVSWEGTFYFPCHFMDDTISFDNIMFQIWQLKELKFESLLP